jgi:shikimate kinase
MLGGLTVTDNDADELLATADPDWAVLVWVPPDRAYSADADVGRCERITPLADLAADLVAAERYGLGMTVNGFAFAGALGFPADPLVDALPDAAGVSLSGTGPAVVAVGDRDRLETARSAFERRAGDAWLTTTRATGARRTGDHS